MTARRSLRPDRRALDVAYVAARGEAWRGELEEDWVETEVEGWPE